MISKNGNIYDHDKANGHHDRAFARMFGECPIHPGGGWGNRPEAPLADSVRPRRSVIEARSGRPAGSLLRVGNPTFTPAEERGLTWLPS